MSVSIVAPALPKTELSSRQAGLCITIKSGGAAGAEKISQLIHRRALKSWRTRDTLGAEYVERDAGQANAGRRAAARAVREKTWHTAFAANLLMSNYVNE